MAWSLPVWNRPVKPKLYLLSCQTVTSEKVLEQWLKLVNCILFYLQNCLIWIYYLWRNNLLYATVPFTSCTVRFLLSFIFLTINLLRLGRRLQQLTLLSIILIHKIWESNDNNSRCRHFNVKFIHAYVRVNFHLMALRGTWNSEKCLFSFSK